LELLFNPERASRLILHKSIDKSQLGLVELIDVVIENTFKMNHDDTYFQELQNVINSQVLNQLFLLAANQKTYMQVNAIVNYKLDEIGKLLRNKNSSILQKMYDDEMIQRIDNFKKNPTNYKKAIAPKIPDGSPIGMD
jgi:Mg/Co/Ni transporter MgtE